MLGFAILWTLTTFLITVRDYLRLASALREGRCEIVEGEVTKFHPMPAEGHHEESFDVGGKHFQYADYIVIAGFNQSSSHGGPVREGIKVRIYHVGNIIARLEIAR